MKKYFAYGAFLLMLFLGGCSGKNNADFSNTAEQVTKLQTVRETVSESITSEVPNDNLKEDKSMKISIKSSEYEVIFELNNSKGAAELYSQLPLTVEAKPFSNNEITFYPPNKLITEDTPLSGGESGSLSYYEPWGDVVMFYAPCAPNGSLYEIGTAISGIDDIEKLSGTMTVSACE